jgi:hypothetical protein
MRKMGNMKWLAAGCGVIALATLLVLSPGPSGDRSRESRLSAQTHNPSAGTSSPLSLPSLPNNLKLANSKIDQSQIMKRYAQLPLAFESGESASSDQVKFLARGNGYTLLLATNQTTLKLRGPANHATLVSMKLANSNAVPKFSALEQLPGKSNYLIGKDPENWRTNVAQYRRVRESNVYKGIDLVYYGTQGQLEYDFDVAPGGDPSKIQLAFEGSEKIHVGAQGELIIATPGGDVLLQKPVAYQEIAGVKQPVAVSYSLTEKNSATFQIAAYDNHLPLVIDPVLSYSTFLGGNNIDSSNAIAVAPDDTSFVAGATFSSNFPTVHALQANAGGQPDFAQDAFVAKISSDGSQLLYATYLGGINSDVGNGIAVDTFGNAYITGYTESPNFPVTFGSANVLCGGDGKCGATWNPGGLIVSNAFVTKLNAAGSGLIYSTFLGEYEHVRGQAIAVDADGAAYVTGQTTDNITPTVVITPPNVGPPPFPISGSAFQTTFGGGAWDTFVTKVSATGSEFEYSSYLGGNDEDLGYGIAVDATSNVYITGVTYSTNFPRVAALQVTFGGAGDGFVAKVNTRGAGPSSLLYSTYLGGAGVDQGNGIAVDTAGNAYAAGVTNGAISAFPVSGVQTTYAGQGDAFLARLSPTGGLSYFTYLGGTKADSATGVAVDSGGNAYVTGSTVSADFPIAGSVFQPTYGGGNADSFVAKFDPTGTTLLYSSFLGGTNTELATGIAVDATGSAYVTGQTCSDDFPLSNPAQAVPGGNCDAYVARISIIPGVALNPGGLVFSAQSLDTTSQPEVVTLTNGDNPQTIASIVITGPNAADFSQTNTCLANPSLSIGATCAISVTFRPSAPGIRKASIVITDTAIGSPHIVNLTGNTSSVTLSAASLSFGSVQVGLQSSPQTVTVTNNSNNPLLISNVVASGDFSESDTCVKATLQAHTNCVISVTFTPSAAIGSIGAVTLFDNGAGSPQVIMVTGTGVALAITSLTPTPTISAGQTAKYTLSVPPIAGNGQSVKLTCSVMESNSNTTCQVSPDTVSPTFASPGISTMTVSTALRTSVPAGPAFKPSPLSGGRPMATIWLVSLAAMMMLSMAALRRRLLTASFGFAIVLLLGSVGCGGSSSGGSYSTAAGTPPMIYHVQVVGTAASGTSSATQVILQVN